MKCKSSKKKHVRTVEAHQYGRNNSSSSEYDLVGSVTTKERVNGVRQEIIKAKMMVERKLIAFQLDSGASVNI